MLGLYIHLPFCRKICSYCDFYKMVVSDNFQEKFIKYLSKEMRLKLSDPLLNQKFSTIYIGGGTPSALSYKNLETLFSELNKYLSLESMQEITFEMNPEDITESLLQLLKNNHVTRISIGIQSFNPRILKILNRKSDYQDMKEKAALLRRIGFRNYNLDLIYGISDETIDEVMDDLKKILSLNPTHISTYSLIIEDKTIISHLRKNGKYRDCEEEVDVRMYDAIVSHLSQYHFKRYETSNFALPGYESKHNLIYWSNEYYLALGPSASSYYNDQRFQTVANLSKYYHGLDNDFVAVEYQNQLTKVDIANDILMLGLRKSAGVNIKWFEKETGLDIFTFVPNLNSLLDEKLLVIKDDENLAINEQYFYIANFILLKLLNL